MPNAYSQVAFLVVWKGFYLKATALWALSEIGEGSMVAMFSDSSIKFATFVTTVNTLEHDEDYSLLNFEKSQ